MNIYIFGREFVGNHFLKSNRGGGRIFASLVILFIGGAAAAYFLYYLPELKKKNNKLTDLPNKTQKIDKSNKELSRKVQNETKKKEQSKRVQKAKKRKSNLTKELRKVVSGSAAEILSKAKKMFNKGLKYDRLSLPGMDNFEENIEKAKYYYLLARQLYKKTAGKGADIEDRIVEVNKALFWLRKRSGI